MSQVYFKEREARGILHQVDPIQPAVVNYANAEKWLSNLFANQTSRQFFQQVNFLYD